MIVRNLFDKWIPLDDLPETMYIRAIHNDCEGFRVILEEENPSRLIRIYFKDVLVFRKIDEGHYLRTLENIDSSTLFKSKKSEYLEWFISEQKQILNRDSVTHYAIYTPNDCLDIIASVPAIVQKI